MKPSGMSSSLAPEACLAAATPLAEAISGVVSV
eukprot:CAMPEP_0179408616 /NCGR_PEP_ID=MMETSP0799-20121207/2203_1 /TAXON_ID=46947 /ORGANISM="Geminigera cryophila, Strain CCMP2564" /LENGTH=32 /DNA_ID= /DNA_START= /DNA_END= /DNA_ORIENTATION=